MSFDQCATTGELNGIKPGCLTDEVLLSDKPLILRSYAEDWPAVKAGQKSSESMVNYLRRFYSQEPLTVCHGDDDCNGRIYYNTGFTGFNHSTKRYDFNTFLDEILEKNGEQALYMPSTNAERWFPGFDRENDAKIPEVEAFKFIWAGNRTRIAAHYDFLDNFAVCISGKRRFTLFPPEQITNLYPGPLDFAPGGQEISMVDFAHPDFEKFPKFRRALDAAQVALLEPGDALFLPGMWWHHVEGLDNFNVLLTHWWRNSPKYLGRPANALLHAVLALRSLPPTQRKAWQALFNHYVFERDAADIDAIPVGAQGSLTLPLSDPEARKLRAELIRRLKAL